MRKFYGREMGMYDFKCRTCKSTESSTVLTGKLPLVAEVGTKPSREVKKYPLDVVRCSYCGHIQLRETVDVNLYENYLFTPSYTSEFALYIENFCKKLNNEIKCQQKRCFLEIGSSNGCLLKKLKENNWEVLGIEPSAPMVKVAALQGVDTIHGYFAETAFEEIQRRMKHPNVVILRHVLEHLDHLNEIIALIRRILADNLLVIEVPYVKKSIQQKRFYDFFHEHLSYFSVTTLNNLLNAGGFYIHQVYETPEVGGSILIFSDTDNTHRLRDNVNDYLQDEKVSLSDEWIDLFSKTVSNNIISIKTIVKEAKLKGKKLPAGERAKGDVP